ncbi:histidine phosphatase family protein [Clostridium chauvoei]|uniref:Histidine phosphatase family protein n=2 Tax=Clostridium chauvoei TaxID=46867 RepID=A0ABD4REG1_9CLOT|nr:histidine phosphatase family protein [Clostridium chauvoei]ATD54213.1 histidine phosphatase family protein [Clostridium chauvoei]ATD58107.1 histidine phosphatase family protein [Clostridium chauvoei]MBX7279819.1 histidine phosphatase family protein [Clostridium chauvoei]MBX7282263.1 histidine phosphatase family protein [Clostridium chauvoei]MBX7284709.1 histidine phosphatase family protein [Clostridium chauvoei]
MTKLYLTRHGETEWNTQGIMQGWGDSPLSELGIKQGEWLAERIKETPIDVIYTSPTGRAYNTAKIVRGNKNIEIIPHDGLREIRVGNWEGLNQDQLRELDEKNYNNFWNTPSKYVPTGNGETFMEVKERSFAAINEILQKEKGRNILVVTHTIALKTFLIALENKDIDTLWEPPFIKQTSLTEIDFDDNGHKYLLTACMKHHKYSKKEYNEFK